MIFSVTVYFYSNNNNNNNQFVKYTIFIKCLYIYVDLKMKQESCFKYICFSAMFDGFAVNYNIESVCHLCFNVTLFKITKKKFLLQLYLAL